MKHSVIAKAAVPSRAPNLLDYAAARAQFSWEKEAARLARLPDGGLNIVHHILDRHADGPAAERRAFRFLAAGEPARDLSFRALRTAANRLANVLTQLGIRRGERVATLAGRIPELYVTALGTLKAGAVYLPLFSAFGPEPVKSRLELGGARALVTTDLLYRRKVAPVRDALRELAQVLVIRTHPGSELPADTLDFHALMDAAGEHYQTVSTRPEDLALLHFTSGTTGLPKGVMHVHAAVVAHEVTARLALDLHEGEIYWCTADPGWVTGISYGLIAPLACGVSVVVDREEFDPERWYAILEQERVAVWYTAPTAIRMLMKAGTDLTREHRYPDLRFLASVGEPLNPEAVIWGVEAFGMPFHDNWWQTETGAIMIANYASMDIRPGSMGKPLPGIDAAIVRRLGDGSAELIESPDEVGELALKPGWPSMFRGYLNNEERYRSSFVSGWYLSGDLARRDAEGYFWFVGRADDVIKSAGHLISPFEVESALMTHPAVAQAAVIGVPDPIVGEAVKAFIELKPGRLPDEALRKDVMAHARRKLGAAVAPREIAVSEGLPRTRSGKIMRRLLKARELGLPEGDLSTLEDSS